MIKCQISEHCPIRGRQVWIGEFNSLAEAYEAIEYFGSVTVLSEQP